MKDDGFSIAAIETLIGGGVSEIYKWFGQDERMAERDND